MEESTKTSRKEFRIPVRSAAQSAIYARRVWAIWNALRGKHAGRSFGEIVERCKVPADSRLGREKEILALRAALDAATEAHVFVREKGLYVRGAMKPVKPQ
jgi:hypothetical protein